MSRHPAFDEPVGVFASLTTKRTGALCTALAAVAVATLPVTSAQAMAGGDPVKSDREAPWMATLAVKGEEPLPQRASCGGALVAPDKVLTAAHCVDVPELADLAEYHVGARVLPDEDGQVAGIAEVDVHPEYELVPSPEKPDDPAASSAAHDIAVITLDRPLPDVPTLQVATTAPPVGTPATFYGHGLTSETTRGDVLARGSYGIRANELCSTRTPAVVDEESMLCARSPRAAACTGDSGGPLVIRHQGRTEVVGVFSFGMETAGEPCGTPGPNFFTDVAAAGTWLEDQLVDVE